MKKVISIVLMFVLAISLATFASANTKENPITWDTETVSLSADDFYITVDGKNYIPNLSVKVSSDPGDPKYTTLEAIWFQDEIEMRMNFYFISDSQNYWVSEARVYNGKNPADWIIWENAQLFKSQLGEEATTKNFIISLSENASINFKNLKLIAFKKDKLDSESIIPPGKFEISKYMADGFIRTNNVSIQIDNDYETVYSSSNGYIIFQAAEPMSIYLPYGGYYQQSGTAFNEYNDQLTKANIKCPQIITGQTEASILRTLLQKYKEAITIFWQFYLSQD